MRSLKLFIPLFVLFVCFAVANAEAQTRIDREAYIAYLEALPLSPAVSALERRAKRAVLCNAANVYHESRGEGLKGMMAAAQAAPNRARATGRPLCREIWRERAFSWTLAPRQITDKRSWFKAQGVAFKVYKNELGAFQIGATHYHRHDISPKWSAAGIGKKRIGNHIFMRLKGEF